MTPWLYLSRWIVPYAVGRTVLRIAAWSFFWPPEMSPFTACRPLMRPQVLMKKPYVKVVDACGAAAPNVGFVFNFMLLLLFALIISAAAACTRPVSSSQTL